MLAPIRTAIIGFGTSGRIFHAPFLAHDEAFSLDAIVTSNDARRAEASSEHPGARLLDDPKALWREADRLDLVVIGSPSGTHRELATAALEAGLDVVVDKPLVATAVEGEALIARAADLGRRLTVFQNRRWDGDFQTLRQLVETGELGDVRRFESRFEWWQPQPKPGWKSAATVAEAGGILYDLGTHLIDQALQLFGPVEGVHAEVRTRRESAAADDDAFLTLEHRSGVLSHLSMSAVAPVFGPRFHVLGSRAGYQSWGLDRQEPALIAGSRPGDPGFGETPEERWGVLGAGAEQRRIPTLRGDYGAFYRALAEALRSGGPLPVDPADAIAALRIIERAHAASH